jgi:hypothetical protein
VTKLLGFPIDKADRENREAVVFEAGGEIARGATQS